MMNMLYKRLITEATNVTSIDDIMEIESQMRDQHNGTLDHLSARGFSKSAKQAERILKEAEII